MEYKIKCPHNDAVGCFPSQRNCNRCGWNPDVAKERLEKFCKKHGVTMPKPEPKSEEE